MLIQLPVLSHLIISACFANVMAWSVVKRTSPILPYFMFGTDFVPKIFILTAPFIRILTQSIWVDSCDMAWYKHSKSSLWCWWILWHIFHLCFGKVVNVHFHCVRCNYIIDICLRLLLSQDLNSYAAQFCKKNPWENSHKLYGFRRFQQKKRKLIPDTFPKELK